MFEKIKERYLRNYITGTQLASYVRLKVITQTEADEIKAIKSGNTNAVDAPSPEEI